MEQLITFKELHGTQRNLNDSQRSRISKKGRKLPWNVMKDLSIIAHPVTVSGWHRRYNLGIVYKRAEESVRAKQRKVVREFIIRLAKENPWGYGKLVGALKCLGIRTCRSTVRNVLKEANIDPSPTRGFRLKWKDFLTSNWSDMAAMDFFQIKVITLRGIVDFYVHFVIDIATREVTVTNVNSDWDETVMMQVGRQLIDYEDGFLKDKKYVIMDRDPLYTKEFRLLLKQNGCTPVRTSVRAPKMNNYAERFVRSIKEECLNKLIFISGESLRHAVSEYVEFYNHERP